jgi:hypothetical protein
MPPPSNVIVPLPDPPERATAVRGTVLLSSQGSLREGNHYERYVGLIEPAHRGVLIDGIVPNTWVPIEHAMAHYRACEALGLSTAQVQAAGAGTGGRINSVFIKSIIRLATGAVEPWFAWGLAQRIWSRAWQGSAVGVRRTGPKDARVDVVGFPCAAIPYVRVSLGAFFAKNTELFCKHAVARSVRPDSDPAEALSYVVSWV